MTSVPPEAPRQRRRPQAIRKTAENSGFSRILDDLVAFTPGCRAVAFVDQEGEAVDVAGSGDEFDVKVVGAHTNVLIDQAKSLGQVRRMIILGRSRSFAAVALPEGYSLVFILDRLSAFHLSERALSYAFSELGVEAGFAKGTRAHHRWFPVEIGPRGDKDTRPQRLRAARTETWHDVNVLGQLMGLGRGERGYRVRTQKGIEAMLVREPLGRWWCDEPVERSEGRPKYAPNIDIDLVERR